MHHNDTPLDTDDVFPRGQVQSLIDQCERLQNALRELSEDYSREIGAAPVSDNRLIATLLWLKPGDLDPVQPKSVAMEQARKARIKGLRPSIPMTQAPPPSPYKQHLDRNEEETPDDDECPFPLRADGKEHSWRWDGDDPRIICVYCGEMRDALNGRVYRRGRKA